MLLSARELDAAALPTRTFVNEHLTFTHGMGLTMGPTNEVTPEGLPVLWVKDLPPASSIKLPIAGRRALVVPADLSDLDNVAGLATAAHETFGRLDVVINNVGGTIPNAFLDTTTEYMEEAFHFSVATAHALCRAAVPLMLESGCKCKP